MIEKDLNKIAKIEKAIKEKYGKEAIQNPNGSWNKEKEKKYLKEVEAFYKNSDKEKKKRKLKGFILKSNKQLTPTVRTCPVCDSYSFDLNDDLYMLRYDCCFGCFIEYVDGREERWKSGWRPNS